MAADNCAVDICPDAADSKGWCRKHYMRWYRNGDPLALGCRPNGEVRKVLETGAHADTDECIYFPGRKGRPRVKLDGKGMQASRAVWIIAHGDPGEQSVLHTCRNGERGCINVRHLYLGDQTQNCRDIATAGNRKGVATVRGEQVGTSTLTADDVREIRRIYAEGGVRQADLGARYGIDQTAVSSIVLRKSWKHVA